MAAPPLVGAPCTCDCGFSPFGCCDGAGCDGPPADATWAAINVPLGAFDFVHATLDTGQPWVGIPVGVVIAPATAATIVGNDAIHVIFANGPLGIDQPDCCTDVYTTTLSVIASGGHEGPYHVFSDTNSVRGMIGQAVHAGAAGFEWADETLAVFGAMAFDPTAGTMSVTWDGSSLVGGGGLSGTVVAPYASEPGWRSGFMTSSHGPFIRGVTFGCS